MKFNKKLQNATIQYRNMRGGSMMGKPSRNMDKLVPRNSSIIIRPTEMSTEPISNYTCICSNGWTGPNCEIGECINVMLLQSSHYYIFADDGSVAVHARTHNRYLVRVIFSFFYF